MPKKLCFLISLILSLSLASISYGAPSQIWLDFDEATDVNTEPGCTSFLISDSGTTINGITIDLSGDIDDQRRGDPSNWGVSDELYRDFIYGISPSGVNITLWGLGVGQNCNITLWAFDNNSDPNRIARWYSNGAYIFTTNFSANEWPWCLENPCLDGPTHAYDAAVTADAFGKIKLTSVMDPKSATPFAFVNALRVIPQGAFVPTIYANSPQPGDGAKDIPADVILRWKTGAGAEKHDVYFGTDEAKVTDANRSNPLGVLISENQDSNSYDPYGTGGFLKIGTYYYWRIDEVNTTPEPQTITKGDIWSFLTVSNYLVEDFDSYADNDALREVWKDYTANGTGAEVSVETAIASDGNSMRYSYKNNLPPYYSEVYADITDLGINDPNLSGIGAQALVLYFYGEPANPLSEQMYVKLTDGDNPPKTATVPYSNINDTRLKQWNKWSIPLAKFTDANLANDVNLANISRITIGFGDTSPGSAGAVYIEDIQLNAKVEVLTEATGDVNTSVVYQEIEGFGAAGGWNESYVLAMPQPDRNNFYDAVFNELSLDIYRLRNTYDQGSGGASYIDNSALIVAAGKARNPSLKIMISSWSPPVYLKSNDYLVGGTLKKDPSDPCASPPYYYKYNAFAQWWTDSLVDWSNHGVVADYISMQNEPDYLATWDSCRFNATPTTSYAGYREAFRALYTNLNQLPSRPKLLAPEAVSTTSSGSYINALSATDKSNVYGWAHHLYGGGGSYSYPDGYINNMINFRNNYSDKPRMMTEFSKGGSPGNVTTFTEAMNLAQLMHNALFFERVSAYIYWELFWPYPKGLVSIMGYGGGFQINPIYYAFKQYSAFIHPGWHRVEVSNSLGDRGNVRISAFKSPDNRQLSIVIINLAYNNINLTLDLNGFLPISSEIYRTSETEHTTYIGPYDENGWLMLPARSITTIHSPVLSNCPNVLAAGYGLTSDIDPDCYVNYNDLKIITDYWLNTDCALYDDCGGADFEPTDGVVNLFDLSIFAEQWMMCNDPEDPDCTANWP
jgi:glucuronoarabinoxylan endo-1,4-beta-xylanase